MDNDGCSEYDFYGNIIWIWPTGVRWAFVSKGGCSALPEGCLPMSMMCCALSDPNTDQWGMRQSNVLNKLNMSAAKCCFQRSALFMSCQQTIHALANIHSAKVECLVCVWDWISAVFNMVYFVKPAEYINSGLVQNSISVCTTGNVVQINVCLQGGKPRACLESYKA